MADLLVLPEPAESMQNGKNLNKLGLRKKKDWPYCHKISNWQGRQHGHCQKEKSNLYRSLLSSIAEQISIEQTGEVV